MAGCTGDLPLSDLINNTVTLKILGTYESNDPYAFFNLKKDDIINSGITNSSPTLNASTDIYQYITGTLANSFNDGLEDDYTRVRYYIDIAEVRIAEGQGKSSSQSISDYWSQFAISRQLMCSSYATADNKTLANCSDSNGIQRLSDFFNGGFTYPAVDIKAGFYNHLGVYFRRFSTFPSAIFNGSGSYIDGAGSVLTSVAAAETVPTTTFDNRQIYGTDIESFLQNKYGETATEPLMFPLQRKDLSIRLTDAYEPYVLEVRIFLKNLMMIHLTQNPVSPNTSLVYVAPSDWNIDHAFRDATNGGKMGGSVIMTARIYQPAKVGSIQIPSTAGTGEYFVAVPSDTVFDATTTLPYAATAGNNQIIKNLPPGTYKVYRTCDLKYCSNNSTAGTCDNMAATNKDGFPETQSTVPVTVTVTAGTMTSAPSTPTCP